MALLGQLDQRQCRGDGLMQLRFHPQVPLPRYPIAAVSIGHFAA